MKVYTKRGDDGTTGLFFGGRVPKDSPLPTAYGSVDEAQASLGLARAVWASRAELSTPADMGQILISLERDLWVVMADLATGADNRHKLAAGSTLVTPEMISRLEELIDDTSARFELPTEFVVPGESVVGAALDVARTVVRRAERDAVAAAIEGSLAVAYLNRLSDLVWTLARWEEGVSLITKSVEPT